MRSAFSKTVTAWPARASCCAAASPAGPEPITATVLPAPLSRQLGMDPALHEAALDDALFDLLDRHRRLVDAQHAGGFARRGTNPAGELREIVGRVQRAHRFFPAALVHQVVPVGNEVVQRAARVAERHAAIHAARALRPQLLLGRSRINLEPVVDPFGDRPPLGISRRILHKSGDLPMLHPCPNCRRLVRAELTGNMAPRTRLTPSTRLYSCGNTLMNFGSSSRPVLQNPRGARASGEIAMPCRSDVAPDRCPPVRRAAPDRPTPGCSAFRRSRPPRPARRRCRRSCRRRSSARIGPSTTTSPLVMYSQP